MSCRPEHGHFDCFQPEWRQFLTFITVYSALRTSSVHVCLYCCPDDGYSMVAETIGTILIKILQRLVYNKHDR